MSFAHEPVPPPPQTREITTWPEPERSEMTRGIRARVVGTFTEGCVPSRLYKLLSRQVVGGVPLFFYMVLFYNV